MTSSQTRSTDNNPSRQCAGGVNLKGGMTAHALLQISVDMDWPKTHEAIVQMQQDDPDGLRFTPCILAFPGREGLPDWLPQLVTLLREQQLVPFAVQCEGAADQQAVNALGLADLPVPEPSFRKPRATRSQPVRHCQVVSHQVRSGQQIYARDADLVILASVSAGAEVMADHDIHIYGDLRGRALAGVKGNQQAQVFCQNLDAELVAVAGVYCMPDQFPTHRTRAQIYLDGEHLVINSSQESASSRKSAAR